MLTIRSGGSKKAWRINAERERDTNHTAPPEPVRQRTNPGTSRKQTTEATSPQQQPMECEANTKGVEHTVLAVGELDNVAQRVAHRRVVLHHLFRTWTNTTQQQFDEKTRWGRRRGFVSGLGARSAIDSNSSGQGHTRTKRCQAIASNNPATIDIQLNQRRWDRKGSRKSFVPRPPCP